MIEPLKKITTEMEVPLSEHPMMSHLVGKKMVEHWDLSQLPEKLNEVIEAVNQIQQFINRDNPLQPPFPPVVRDVPSVTEVLARASENMFARLLPDSGSHD